MNQKPSAKGLIYLRMPNSQAEEEFSFQFNPTTISERHGVRYHFPDAQGQYMPLTQFGMKEPIELGFELFFYDNRGVNNQLKFLRRLVSPMFPKAIVDYEQAAPPVCRLSLDQIGIYTGVFEDISINIDKYKKSNLEAQSVRAQVRFKVVSDGPRQDQSFYLRSTGRG
jgi:hypothetical protein